MERGQNQSLSPFRREVWREVKIVPHLLLGERFGERSKLYLTLIDNRYIYLKTDNKKGAAKLKSATPNLKYSITTQHSYSAQAISLGS